MNDDTPPAPPEKPGKHDSRRRLRRLILLTAIAAVVAVLGALAWLSASGVALRLHMIVATSLGVGLSVMLGGVLMALVFYSAGSGMDNAPGHKDDE